MCDEGEFQSSQYGTSEWLHAQCQACSMLALTHSALRPCASLQCMLTMSSLILSSWSLDSPPGSTVTTCYTRVLLSFQCLTSKLLLHVPLSIHVCQLAYRQCCSVFVNSKWNLINLQQVVLSNSSMAYSCARQMGTHRFTSIKRGCLSTTSNTL